MAPERSVPILKTDFSILDSEFNSIRERFEQEMHKMEDEMNKFRNELLAREQQSISKSTTSTKETITRITSGIGSSSHKSEFFEEKQSSTQNGAFGSGDDFKSHVTSTGGTHKSELRTWLDGLESPLIKDGNDGKELKLRFDVSQYTPEEIVVKTVDNKLQVQAKHEEKSENRSVYREYNREFLLPKGTNPELIKSSLSKDGVLTVEAPLPAITGGGERMIPIDKF